MSGSEDEEDVSFDDDILSGSSEEEEVVFPGSSEEEEIPGEGPGPTIDVDFPDPERFADPIARRVVQAVAPMYEDLSEDHEELSNDHEDIQAGIDSLQEDIDELEGYIEINVEQLLEDHNEILDVAYEINEQLDNQLTDEDIRTIIREETDIDIDVDGEAKDTWGYGFFNAAYDTASWIRTKTTGRSDHRYEDEDGNPKVFPQDEDLSRRAFLGMGKEALGVAFLGAVADGASDGEFDGNLRGGAPTNGGQNEQKFSYETMYDLSEVEACAADYQMSQAQQFMNKENLSEDDVKVSLSTDGSLEVYGEDEDGEYTEQLFVTDSVSTWTCELER